jgi:hypothetical protein
VAALLRGGWLGENTQESILYDRYLSLSSEKQFGLLVFAPMNV